MLTPSNKDIANLSNQKFDYNKLAKIVTKDYFINFISLEITEYCMENTNQNEISTIEKILYTYLDETGKLLTKVENQHADITAHKIALHFNQATESNKVKYLQSLLIILNSYHF